MHRLVEDVMYVYRGKVTMFGGDVEYHWIYAWHLRLPHVIINQ